MKPRHLTASLRETLEKAVLLGAEFSVPVLLSAGAPPDELDRLFDDGWLAEAGPNRARFVQRARFQEIVATIPWSRKRKWHSELARACEALRQPPSDLAYHHLAAREFEAARPILVRAAEKACLQRRFRQALGFLRQALDIWPADLEPDSRLRSLQEIGYAGLVAAMCGRASEELPEQTALAYRRRANVCEYGADYTGEAVAHLEAIRYCRTAGEKAGELSCLSCLAGAYFRTGEWKEASQTADAVLHDGKAHPAYQAIARTVVAQLAAFRGEQRRAARLLDRSLIELRQLGLNGIDFQVLWAPGVLL